MIEFLREKNLVLKNFIKYKILKNYISHDLWFLKTIKKKSDKALIVYKHPLDFSLNYLGGHTNKIDAYLLVKSLNYCGFIVDFYDHSKIDEIPDLNDYKLLIYNASGGSGKKLDKIKRKFINIPIKIALLTSTHFNIREEQVLSRHDYFLKRHSISFKSKRISKLSDNKFSFFSHAIAMGHTDSLSFLSYSSIKPILYNYLPPLPESIFIKNKENISFSKKSKFNFICLSGGGFISKGIDLLIEVFSKRKNCNLFIFMNVSNYDDILEFYKKKIGKFENIFFNYTSPSSKNYKKIISKSLFAINHSASEALGTSALINIASGLIPINNVYSGIPIKKLGVEISNEKNQLNALNQALDKALSLSDIEINSKLDYCIEYSKQFNPHKIEKEWTRILQDITNNDKSINYE